MTKCYIVDDDAHAVQALERNIKKFPDLALIGSSTDPQEALRQINEGEKPDIVFLDIEMPEMSGMEFADLLPKHIAIVFVTAYIDQGHNAFEKDAVDFVLKPYTFERFVKAVRKAQTFLQKINPLVQHAANDKVYIEQGLHGKMIQLSLADIRYIEAADHYTRIHTTTEQHLTKLTMAALMLKLPQSTFIRVHRSYIVNFQFITTIDKQNIMLNGGVLLPLAASYREEVLNKLKELKQL